MNDKSCTSIRVIGSLWTAGTLLGSRVECRALFVVQGEIMTARYARCDDVVSLPSRLGCQTSRGRTKLGTVGIMRHLLEPIGRRDKRQHEALGVRLFRVASHCVSDSARLHEGTDPVKDWGKKKVEGGLLEVPTERIESPSSRHGIPILAGPWRGRLLTSAF